MPRADWPRRARVGFRHALVPEACPDGPPGMEVVHVRTLRQAVALATGPEPSP